MNNAVNSKKSGFFRSLSKPVELTQGTPWKVILKYSAPIMLSYFLQQIYVLADAVICGQVLSVWEVAGVNDTFALTFIFLQFAFGCTAGFSVITAKCVGLRDKNGVKSSFAAQLLLTLVISLVLTVVSLATLPKMLGVINVTKENAVVYNAAYDYCFYIFLGIFAQMGYNCVCGVLRAYGDSVTPLIFLVISTVLNVGLDILFLVPLGMGPAGAALATVLAQLLSFVGCLVYTFLKYEDLRLSACNFKLTKSVLISHLKQGIPLGMQFSILAVGIIVMQGAVVKFDITEAGTMLESAPAQNGFGAANKLINFLMAFFNGLASGILGFNAQNLGKNDKKRIRQGTLQSLVIMLVIYAVCLAAGLALSVGGKYQYIFMSADKVTAESIMYGNTYIYIDIILYFVLGFLIVVRSAVQGVCLVGYVLGAGTAELTSRTLICSFLPEIVNGAAVNSSASRAAFAAVCFGDPGAWILASAVLLIPFFGYILNKNAEFIK